jgi:Xaa-Pro dipeptidase
MALTLESLVAAVHDEDPGLVDLGSHQPAFPDFARQEHERRWARFARMLEVHGLDAAILTQEEPIRYLTGYNSVVWGVGRWLPTALLATADPRQAVLLPSAFDAGAATGTSWVETVDGHLDPGELPGKIDQHCRRLGITSDRIGMETGRGSFLMMPWPVAKALVDIASGDPVDISMGISALRIVKSTAELDRIRTVVSATTRAFGAGIEAARAGMTERELVAVVASRMHDLGATAGTRPTFLNCVSGRERHAVVDAPASDQPMRDGDVVFLDGGGGSDGYMSDIIRLIGIGDVGSTSRDYAALALEALTQTIATVRPGALASDLFRSGHEVFAAAGLDEASGSLAGHGIGMEIWERPFIRDHSADIAEEVALRPGMTMSLEPMVFPSDDDGVVGIFVLEHQVLVTEDGVEVLSHETEAKLWPA